MLDHQHALYGRTGAMRQSLGREKLRPILHEIMEKNPGLSEDQINDICWNTFASMDAYDESKHNGMFRATFEAWFANEYVNLTRARRITESRQPTARTITEQITKERRLEIADTVLMKAVRDKAHIILSEMVLPNGKAVKDCTGQECETLGPIVGNWITKVGKRVGKENVVSNILSEDQLQEIYTQD